jgi:hypothetical protein
LSLSSAVASVSIVDRLLLASAALTAAMTSAVVRG